MERNTQMWLIGGFVLIIGIAVVAAAIASQGAQQSGTTNFVGTTAAAIDPSDHVKGDATSSVSVIEYGDFECPACGAWEPAVEQIEAVYGNRVKFVFRNFPLSQLHPNAMIAAQAAEAAGLQGKYWEMHDLLYQKQNDWVNTPNDQVVTKNFDGYAQSLGLDVTKFNTDINSDAVKARVQRDIASGNAAQVDHTPTFFVNLQQIQNPNSPQQFAQILDQTLASSSVSTSSASH
ncbi:MAG TPA: thioredoxin domain-containing protein [Candidatus Paceibacterota bacterium]|nr:thioredoxin domain-containing protein [Candidatus Paceibacterota bacterium]